LEAFVYAFLYTDFVGDIKRATNISNFIGPCAIVSNKCNCIFEFGYLFCIEKVVYYWNPKMLAIIGILNAKMPFSYCMECILKSNKWAKINLTFSISEICFTKNAEMHLLKKI